MARKKKNAPPPPPPAQENVATRTEQPIPPPSPPPDLLFRKKLDRMDTTDVLGQIVIEDCRDDMKTALAKLVEEKRYFCLRVMSRDPLNNLHELRFMNYFGGRYALFHKWGDVVSLNDLREGNIVDCCGNFVYEDEIGAKLFIHRNDPLMVNPSQSNSSPENREDKEQESPENPEEKEQESPEKPDQETDAVNQEEEVGLKSLQFKHLLKIPIIPEVVAETDQQPEGHVVEEIIIPTPVEGQIPAMDFLFEKKLDYADVDPDLDRLVFTRCSKRLKTALEVTPRIRVSTVGPSNNVEHTPLLFTRYIIGAMYALYSEYWGQVVAQNDLKEGDTVVGYGNDLGGGGGEFSLQLYILRDEPPPSDAKKEKRQKSDEGLEMGEERKKEKRRKKEEDQKKEEERKKVEERKIEEDRKKEEERKKEGERKKDAGRVTLLLLGKDSAAVIGRVVINSSERVEEVVVVAREGEIEGYYDDEGRGFASCAAEGANGVKYEWSEEVDEDGSIKSVDGAVVGDGEFQMSIDVYKGCH